MIILREPTTFDAVAPGVVAWVAKESKKENLDAREIYAQKPYEDSRARIETSLRSELFLSHSSNVEEREWGRKWVHEREKDGKCMV